MTVDGVASMTTGDVLADPPVSLGDVIADRYRLEGILDTGGMGVICVARHVQLGLPVAIKFLRREWCRDPRMVSRFVEEAKAACALQSEHIVRVMDFGVLPPDTPYLVMDHLEGTNLGTLVDRRGPLPIDLAVEYVLQACAALDTAHSAGIVHRDIKPENLFLATAGNKAVIKLVDFGIAKRIDADAKRMTGPQEQMGSPYYMSPEQIAAPQSVDARTDIWSLGVVLYRLLTGDVPFDGDSVPTICARVLHAAPRPLRELRPDATPELETIIEHCLQKDPNHRYASVQELASDLTWCREEMNRTFPLELRRPMKVLTTAPLSVEFDERPTKQDLPIKGVRGRHFVALGALALLSAGVYAAYRFDYIDRTPWIRTQPHSQIQPDVPAITPPEPPSVAESSQYSLQPHGVIESDPAPPEGNLSGEQPELSAEKTEQAAPEAAESPVAPMPQPFQPPRTVRSPPDSERVSDYERYLRANGLRPLREVLSESKPEAPASSEPVPAPPRESAPVPEPPRSSDPKRVPRTGPIDEDDF